MVAKSVCAAQQMDNIPPGLKIAPKAHTIIYYVKRGKPYMLLAMQGIAPVRGRNGIEGKGKGEKANGTAVMAVHRGSKFAPARKGADFSYGIS